jgi:Reverse transcriptase (RNA-dependent DNA polymerase)
MPIGFGKKDTIYDVQKSIYGLKTVAITWYIAFQEAITESGFIQSKFDECLFIKDQIYVTVHVDDLGIYNDPQDTVLTSLRKHFDVTTSSEDSQSYLGMEVQRD